MKALLLIAGQSTRFWPLMDKNFFPVCGKTILEHQVERLRRGGVKEIILVGGIHNLQKAHSLFPKLKLIKQEKLDLGMRGALLSALPNLPEEPIMVVGGNDIIETSGFTSLITYVKRGDVDGAVLAQKVKRYFPGGYVKIVGGKIVSIVEKPGEGKEPSDIVNIVAHIHKNPRALLEALRNTDCRGDDGYERALGKIFRTLTYHAVPYEGAWHPIKYPWHLLSLLSVILKETSKRYIHHNVVIHPSAVVDGNVTLSDGVRILPHATVIGPCFVGKNCTIATNALVRESSIGEKSTIGFGSEIARSVLKGNIWTHLSYVGDSVFGQNVALGAGSITGNLRFDEERIFSYVKGERIQTGLQKLGVIIGDDVRIGIHTGTNPGVKIGSGSFIRSGTMVSEDVPNGSYVQIKEGEVLVTPNKKAPPPLRE